MTTPKTLEERVAEYQAGGPGDSDALLGECFADRERLKAALAIAYTHFEGCESAWEKGNRTDPNYPSEKEQLDKILSNNESKKP